MHLPAPFLRQNHGVNPTQQPFTTPARCDQTFDRSNVPRAGVPTAGRRAFLGRLEDSVPRRSTGGVLIRRCPTCGVSSTAPAGSSGATLLHPLHYDTGPVLVVSQPALRALEGEPDDLVVLRLPAQDTVSSRPLRRRYPGPGCAPAAMRSERKRREDSASLRKRLRTGVVQCAGMLRGQELVHSFPADAVAGTDLLRLELTGLYHLQHVLLADAHVQRGLR